MEETKAKLLELAIKRLNGLGVLNVDDSLISVYLDEVVEQVLVNLNRGEIPDGLINTVGGMIAGKYLLTVLASSSATTAAGLTLESGVSSINEGDISVSFAGATSEADNLKNIANELITPNKALLARYRRLL